ncbi:hypothetical protein I4U23_023945 [Adineta vaga]|nr:hypothetical protein I4U23_023945 [Adineta vaga]
MATINSSGKQQLQDLVTCAICLDYYTDPRILPCSHTFCYNCIQKSVQNGRLSCPFRDNQIVDQNAIEQLPINRTAKDMVGFISNINSSKPKKSDDVCGNCNENSAVNWCEKCGFHYCESCTKTVHSIKALQSHKIVPSSDKTTSFCSEHTDEQFRFWCTKCSTLVCRDCLLFEHKDHKFLPIKDAAAGKKVELEQMAQELFRMKQNLIQFSDVTKNAIAQQYEIIRHEKQTIQQTFADLQRLLEERKDVLIKQLHDEQVETMKILTQHQMKIDEHSKLTTVQEFCVRKILDSSDSVQILKFKSNVSQDHKNLTEQYQKIGEGCTVQRHTFQRDQKDFENLAQICSTYGHIQSEMYLVRRNAIINRLVPLDISKPNGPSTPTSKTMNWVRGYMFTVKQPIQLGAVRIQSDYRGRHIGFVVNDDGVVIQHETIHSDNTNMNWITIPLICEIKNNYSVFVWALSGNGSYIYKDGDTQWRVINQNCSVKSAAIQAVTKIIRGLGVTTTDNRFAINMILDIEE